MSQKLKKNYWNEIFFLDFFFLRILRYNRLKIHKIFLKNVKYNRNKKLLDVGTTSLLNNTDNIILHECKNNENIVSISNSIPEIFTLTFPTTTSNPNENGLGYNLGFLKTKYLNASSYTAETVPDVIQDTYVYLAINDYALMETPSFGNTYFNALAKITLPGAKNTVVFDNNYTNSSSKEYHFQQPTNINRFEIRILDGYGNQVNLKGASFSLTIELQEVLDSSIYEKMLEL
jgi:hypothetical protein